MNSKQSVVSGQPIEYAEIRLNDEDGNDYINFYVNGITHSYLLEDVFAAVQSIGELSELRTQLLDAKRAMDEYQEYRKRNTLNFQLEKADSYLRNVADALQGGRE